MSDPKDAEKAFREALKAKLSFAMRYGTAGASIMVDIATHEFMRYAQADAEALSQARARIEELERRLRDVSRDVGQVAENVPLRERTALEFLANRCAVDHLEEMHTEQVRESTAHYALYERAEREAADLRGEVERLKNEHAGCNGVILSTTQSNQRLRAELEKAEKALRDIEHLRSEYPMRDARLIAHAALSPSSSPGETQEQEK